MSALPPIRALLLAAVIAAVAGTMSALVVTLEEARGVVVGVDRSEP